MTNVNNKCSWKWQLKLMGISNFGTDCTIFVYKFTVAISLVSLLQQEIFIKYDKSYNTVFWSFIYTGCCLHCSKWGEKIICCLNCLLFLFCAIVLKVVELQIISICSEQNIFILLYKICQHIFQYVCHDWLTDHSQIYRILTLQKHVPKELSLQMIKNQEYSNSNLPNQELQKPEVLHFRRQLCKKDRSLPYRYGPIIPPPRCAWKSLVRRISGFSVA